MPPSGGKNTERHRRKALLVSAIILSAKREEANEASYNTLRERYIVTLAGPTASDLSAVTASSREDQEVAGDE